MTRRFALVDRDGTILYAAANEDYTERPEPADIVRALRGLKPNFPGALTARLKPCPSTNPFRERA